MEAQLGGAPERRAGEPSCAAKWDKRATQGHAAPDHAGEESNDDAPCGRVLMSPHPFGDARTSKRPPPVKTPLPPDEMTDGIYTAVESDGRLKFVLTRRKKPVGQVTLPASEAGQVAASVLAGAYEAFDQAASGLVPAGERKPTYPFVCISGLGLGPCPIEGHACLVVRVGAAEIGFAFPREKLKEFAQSVVRQEVPK